MIVPPNVLLLVVDALRADYVAPYGADVDTPAMAALAADGTVFERAISPAPWTLPSVTSLLTGLHPHEHGATSRSWELERGPTLQSDLSAAGYHCVHVSPTTWIGEWLPQGRGFDDVVEFTGPVHRYFDGGADVRRLSKGVARGSEWYATVLKRALRSDAPLRSLGNAAAFKVTEARGDHWLDTRASDRAAAAVDDALTGLDQSDEPVFLYVHLMDPHLPFYVPDEFRSDVRPPGCSTAEEEREWIQSLMDDVWAIRLGERRLTADERAFLETRYRDEVAYVDSVVGEILDSVDRHGHREDTLVALTGDHGEHLGEDANGRTLIDHQTSVRLPVVHVPLTVRQPGSFGSEHRTDPVQTNYLAETIRAQAGLEYDRSRSLLADDASALPDVVTASYAGVVGSHPPAELADEERLTASRRTAILDDWKLDLVDGRPRAARIDWDESATEDASLAAVPPDVLTRLEAALPPTADERGAADKDLADRGNGDPGSERSMPSEVERRLEDLGYR